MQIATGFTDPGRESAPIFTIEQDVFLLNNWRVLQGQADDPQRHYGKYVRSLGGVLTITNGVSLIRYEAGSLDGFYIIDGYGRFVPSDPNKDIYNRGGYPDVDAVMPNFKMLDKTPPVSSDEIRRFIEYLNHIRQSNNMVGESVDCLLVEDIAVKKRKYNDGNHVLPEYAFPFRLPMVDGVVFDANALRVVFTEMLRYESVYIGYDNVAPGKTPLVVGLDWGHCGLVMPSGVV